MCSLKFRPILFAAMYVDRQTDGRDEAGSLFSPLFSERATNSMTPPPPSFNRYPSNKAQSLASREHPALILMSDTGRILFISLTKAYLSSLTQQERFGTSCNVRSGSYIFIYSSSSHSLTLSEDSDIIHACCKEWKGLNLGEENISQLGFLINGVEICWRLFRLASL